MWSPAVKSNIALAMIETDHLQGELWAEIYYEKELRQYSRAARCRCKEKPFRAPARARRRRLITDSGSVRRSNRPDWPIVRLVADTDDAIQFDLNDLSRNPAIACILARHMSGDLKMHTTEEAVDCSVNHLSQVIDSGLGMSFFDYLSQFRIEHGRELLTKLDGQSSAILNISFTVGLNSNSVFYSAFKKGVGQTPAQYRRTQLQKPH